MNKHKRGHNVVRIIGGKWKGRKLRFSPHASLRPTLGRTRETLFNWLRGELSDLACLDLFAGSGALGFEALSQGARQVTFVDSAKPAIDAIRSNIELLDIADRASAIVADGLNYLSTADIAATLVCLDPPFDRPDLLEGALKIIGQTRRSEQCVIYAETQNPERLEVLVAECGLEIAKTAKAGAAQGALLRCTLR